jgi:hypothetical protein
VYGDHYPPTIKLAHAATHPYKLCIKHLLVYNTDVFCVQRNIRNDRPCFLLHVQNRSCCLDTGLMLQNIHASKRTSWKDTRFPPSMHFSLYCELISRLPHFPDNLLTDGGEIASLTRRPRFTPRKIFLVLISGEDCVDPRAIVRLEG